MNRDLCKIFSLSMLLILFHLNRNSLFPLPCSPSPPQPLPSAVASFENAFYRVLIHNVRIFMNNVLEDLFVPKVQAFFFFIFKLSVLLEIVEQMEEISLWICKYCDQRHSQSLVSHFTSNVSMSLDGSCQEWVN